MTVEEPLDVRAILQALAQRWVIVVVLTAMGIGAGVAHGVLSSPTYRAQASVLLPPAGTDSRGNPVRDIETEAEMGRSDDVLGAAGARLSPAASATDLRAHVTVVTATDDLLVVRASAGSGSGAAAIANVVAAAYVDLSIQAESDLAATSAGSLQAQATVLDDRIRQLNDEIASDVERLADVRSGSADSVHLSAALTGLRADVAAAARQLAELNGRTADVHLQADLHRQGTRVVQPATAPARPSSPRPVRDAATGGLAGLIAGLVLAVVLERTAATGDRTDARRGFASTPVPVGKGRVVRVGDEARWAPPAPVRAAEVSLADTPLVPVQVLLAALRRRWRLCLALAVAGLVGALALSSVFSVPYTGVATVMVGHPSGSDPARNILTDVELAKTLAVAQGAAERLGGHLPAAGLLASVRSAALSSELVRLQVDGPTAAEATRRVDALAGAFVDFRREKFDQQWKAAADAVHQRQDSLGAELASLKDRIEVLAGADPATSPNVQGLTELQADQMTLTSQLTTLSQQMEAGSFDAAEVRGRTEVVDAGHTPVRPFVRTTVVNLVAGMLFGLVLAIGWVIVATITSDRVRSRAEVSRALGAPVAVSIDAASRWRRHAAADDARSRIVRHLGGVLATSNPVAVRGARRLVVVTVDRAGAASDGVASLAQKLAAKGSKVLMAEVTDEGQLQELFAIRLTPEALAGAGQSVTVVPLDWGGSLGRVGALRSTADAVLVLATLDPAVGAHHLAEWATTVVAVVTAGRSTSTWLRSVNEMVSDAGLALDSAVLLDADPGDRTLGRVEASDRSIRTMSPVASKAPRRRPAIVERHPAAGRQTPSGEEPNAGPSSARAQG